MKPLPPWAIDPSGRASEPPALGDLVAAAAGHWPDRLAISDNRDAYTFAEVEDGARALAWWLAGQGVAPGDRVAILAEKCALVPMLAIAIWKCGAVYVPLDASNPPARLQRLIQRLRPRAVIALDERPPVVAGVAWLGRSLLEQVVRRPAPPRASVRHGVEEAAYIIFTSGSTGEPKGVEIGAGSLTAYFGNHNEVLRFTPSSRVFSLAPFHFDVSIEDTILPLSLGAFVHQFRGLPAGPVMRAVMMRERITHLIAVSTLLTIITGDGAAVTRDTFPSLEMVMTGAEVCDPSVINVWKERLPETRVINVYGPTEATIVCFFHEIERVDHDRRAGYPIGRPLAGVSAMIVRDGAEVREPGVSGELWVGGRQVMQRYFDQPEETARRIVVVGGERYYRTGDICSYDANGDVAFEGRADEEVKLAGRRVHLGEIRQIALTCPGVERATVALIARSGRQVIALSVVAADRSTVPQVEAHLGDLLPAYMRPSVIAWTANVLIGATGKTDEALWGERLKDAAQSSSANYFAMTECGNVEPMELDAHV
jgi:amino acid adenylation domain-containing protein